MKGIIIIRDITNLTVPSDFQYTACIHLYERVVWTKYFNGMIFIVIILTKLNMRQHA